MARTASVRRETKETQLTVELALDGAGEGRIDTPLPFFTHMLEAWAKQGAEGLEFYKSGSWGPEGANKLLAQDGRCWRKQ